jgi:cephalosporin hydroxylase
MILGEGTFHQVHGGAATNGTDSDRALMQDEYVKIKGYSFSQPTYRAHFVGTLDPERFEKGLRRPLDRLRHVHSVRDRPFRVSLPADALNKIQQGTLRTRYKGLRLAKNPFDLALYQRVIEQLRPATIIEVGTSEGGSAAWLIDQCRCQELGATKLIAIDIAPPAIELEGVSFHRGDSSAPAKTFPTDCIASAPHPWLVIEDSAHTRDSTIAVLEYFDRYLQPGDMLVVEDGVIADLDGEIYRKLEDGPNRAVAEFLDSAGDRYAIETTLCDFYGRNLTYAPNAWLRRI